VNSADSSAPAGRGARVGGQNNSVVVARCDTANGVQVDTLLQGLLWFVAFLFSTTVHEAAHALAALRGGDPTAYLGGQVSFSPVPHIRREPIGMLLVPLLTAFTNGWAVGWASTPYDPIWAAHYPRRAAAMAAAGPAGNLLIALLAFAALRGGLYLGVFESPETVMFSHLVDAASGAGWLTALGDLLSVLLVLNLLLFVFNMFPFPPLDGASAIGGLLPERAAVALRSFTANPVFSIFGIFIAWQAFPHVVRPIFGALLALVHPADRYS
jgi:Zn-dependent protease